MRLLAPGMEQTLGQKLVIESKPGGAGNIGAREVARAEADGYTILVAACEQFRHQSVPDENAVRSARRIDADRESRGGTDRLLLRIRRFPLATSANSSRMRGQIPGKLNYGSPGNGSINHLLVERLKQVAGIDIIHVPFRGSPPAMLALLANQIQLFPVGLVVGATHLEDGKLVALAVTTEKRIPALPDVPTAIEAGLPDLTISNWWGMAAPRERRSPSSACSIMLSPQPCAIRSSSNALRHWACSCRHRRESNSQRA